jgi:Zn finger protein HypA/HybF involved in hydrogenase expression
MFEYYCKRCSIKIKSDEAGYIECPQCKSGDSIVDYGDCGEYDNMIMGGGRFNWNKK